MFSLDPVLEADTANIGEFDLSLVLLSRDANYPWAILVPKRQSVSEIFQLSALDQQRLIAESSCLARALTEIFTPDKLNIAAIGNAVNQLHVHHVCRYRHDACWPSPVWGQRPPLPYQDQLLNKLIHQLRTELLRQTKVKFV